MRTAFKVFHDWFFTEITPYRPAALRIFFGLLSFLIFLNHYPEATFHFSDEGWLPRSAQLLQYDGNHRWTLLYWLGSAHWTQFFFLVGMLLALLVLIGYATHLVVPLLWLFYMSMKVRNYFVIDGTDWVIQTALMFLIFMKSGTVWSVDALLQKNKLKKLSWAWPLRMLQIQIGLMYLVAGGTKFLGKQWWDGTAVSFLMMSRNYARWDFSWVSGFPFLLLLSQYITWIIPVWEFMFPFLVSYRRTRLVALALGIAVHLSIGLFLKISYFSQAIIATYIIFISDEQLISFVKKLSQYAKSLSFNLEKPVAKKS